MSSKDFFTGGVGQTKVWHVWRADNECDVESGQSFAIMDEPGLAVRFEFREPFGDGCWNNHVQSGIFDPETGTINAAIVDDGECSPAPEADELSITLETDNVHIMAKPGKELIVCRIRDSRFMQVAGEFGAEDDI